MRMNVSVNMFLVLETFQEETVGCEVELGDMASITTY